MTIRTPYPPLKCPHNSENVMLSAAGGERSDPHAESKHPYQGRRNMSRYIEDSTGPPREGVPSAHSPSPILGTDDKSLKPTLRRHPDCRRFSAGAKDLPYDEFVVRDIPCPAGEGAGLRDDASRADPRPQIARRCFAPPEERLRSA